MPPKIKPNNTAEDRKSTRLNSSHVAISYAVFCLKKKILRAQRDGAAGAAVHAGHNEGRQRPGVHHPVQRAPGSADQRGPEAWLQHTACFLGARATPEIDPLSLHDALPI